VKSIRSYQVRTFEVFVAQASNDDGKPVVFSSVPAEADRRQQQLRAVTASPWCRAAHAGHHPERRRRRATILGPTSTLWTSLSRETRGRPRVSSVSAELWC